jgi:predicted transcriptional regulator
MDTESLKVTLTIEERAAYGEQQAKALEELRALEDRLAQVKTQIKGQQTELDARINRISETIRNGYEYREVEVETVKDYDLAIAKFYRKDTGEMYRTRPLTKEERQGELAIEVGKDAPVQDGGLRV